MLSRNSKLRKRGVVLVITLFFMMILGLLAAAMFKIIPQEHLAVRRHLEDQQSHYAATSGIKDVLAWMVNVRSASNTASASWSTPKEPFAVPAGNDYQVVTNINPSQSPWRMTPFDTAVPADTYLGSTANPVTFFYNNMPVLRRSTSLRLSDGWCADVFVFPDKMTAPHAFAIANAGTATGAAAYSGVSVAYRDINGDGVLTPAIGEKYKLRAKANFSTDTLAKFAYFADQWDANTAITLQQGLSRPIFDGPFHSNATPHLYTPGSNAYWQQANAVPSFTSTLTFSDALTGNYANLNHDGLAWEEGNMQNGANNANNRPYDASNNAVASRYQRMMQNGEPAIRNVKRIEMPTDSTPLAKAAWGEQTTITNQATLSNDAVYVNSLSGDPTKAAGGIFVKGNVQKMTLEVLNGTGGKVGDESYGSATPNNANNGNPAVRVTMSTSYQGTTAITPTQSTINGATNYVRTTTTGTQYTSNSSTNYTYTPTSSIRISSSQQTVNFVGPLTSQTTVNFVGPLTSQTTVNYTGPRSSQTTVNYTGPLSSQASSQASSFGTGAGAGTRIYYTVSYTVNYTGPRTSQSTVNYTGPLTSQSTVNYNGPRTSQSTVNYNGPRTSQSTVNYTNGVQNYNLTGTNRTYTGLSTNNPVTYPITGTNYGTSSNVAYTNYSTQMVQPKALVIEANTTPMTLAASNLFAGGNASMSFIVNGATQASLNVSTNNVYTIQQNKQYPNLWEVKSLAMQPDTTSSPVASNYHLNGAVHVNGDIGNRAAGGRSNETDSDFFSQGLSGWNKGRKTIAADKFDWTSPSTSTVTPAQLRIDGHIRVFDTPQGSQISGTNLYKHNVGIMADAVDLKVTRSRFTGNNTVAPFNANANKEMFVYGVIMGRGSQGMYASNVPNGYGGSSVEGLNSGGLAKLRLFGGLLQKSQGVVRVGDKGWDQEYNYDPQNAISPPPFFPVLNDFVIFNYIEDKV